MTDSAIVSACVEEEPSALFTGMTPSADELRSRYSPACRVTEGPQVQMLLVQETRRTLYPRTPCAEPEQKDVHTYTIRRAEGFVPDTTSTSLNYTTCNGTHQAKYEIRTMTTSLRAFTIADIPETTYDTTLYYKVNAPALTASSNVGASCRSNSGAEWRTYSQAIPYDVEAREVSLPVKHPWQIIFAGSYCQIEDEYEVVAW